MSAYIRRLLGRIVVSAGAAAAHHGNLLAVGNRAAALLDAAAAAAQKPPSRGGPAVLGGLRRLAGQCRGDELRRGHDAEARGGRGAGTPAGPAGAVVVVVEAGGPAGAAEAEELAGVPPGAREVEALDAAVAAVVVARVRLTGELLERDALGLGDEQRHERAEEHEERKELQEAVEERRARVVAVAVLGGGGDGRVPASEERDADALRDDGAKLAHGRGQAVRRGAVARREALAGHDKGRRVGSGVEEELADYVEREEGAFGEVPHGEADYCEYDGQGEEAKHLQRLASKCVDSEYGAPVSRERAGAGEDDEPEGLISEPVIQRLASGIADGL